MSKYEQTKIHIQEGDIITSRHGFVTNSIGDLKLHCHRMKYLGNGCFEIIDEPTKFIED